MAYFTEEQFKLVLSPEHFNNIFGKGSNKGWGGISATSGSLRFEMFAEQASGFVDAFLEPAGYSVPIANPSAFMVRCALYRCVIDVLGAMNIPVSEHYVNTAERNESVLHDIATGKIPIPGIPSSTVTGVGGSLSSNSSKPENDAQLSRRKLRGTWM